MNIIKRYWRIIFPIFFAGMIWAFSARNGEASEVQSSTVANAVGMSNELARKVAHFILYSALGYSTTSFIKGLHPTSFPKHTQVFYPIVFTTIYGALDEVHQLTVAGRNGDVSDVLLDTFAGVAGVLTYIAIFCFFRLWKRNRRTKQEFARVEEILNDQEQE